MDTNIVSSAFMPNPNMVLKYLLLESGMAQILDASEETSRLAYHRTDRGSKSPNTYPDWIL